MISGRKCERSHLSLLRFGHHAMTTMERGVSLSRVASWSITRTTLTIATHETGLDATCSATTPHSPLPRIAACLCRPPTLGHHEPTNDKDRPRLGDDATMLGVVVATQTAHVDPRLAPLADRVIYERHLRERLHG